MARNSYSRRVSWPFGYQVLKAVHYRPRHDVLRSFFQEEPIAWSRRSGRVAVCWPVACACLVPDREREALKGSIGCFVRRTVQRERMIVSDVENLVEIVLEALMMYCGQLLSMTSPSNINTVFLIKFSSQKRSDHRSDSRLISSQCSSDAAGTR